MSGTLSRLLKIDYNFFVCHVVDNIFCVGLGDLCAVVYCVFWLIDKYFCRNIATATMVLAAAAMLAK